MKLRDFCDPVKAAIADLLRVPTHRCGGGRSLEFHYTSDQIKTICTAYANGGHN